MLISFIRISVHLVMHFISIIQIAKKKKNWSNLLEKTLKLQLTMKKKKKKKDDGVMVKRISH